MPMDTGASCALGDGNARVVLLLLAVLAVLLRVLLRVPSRRLRRRALLAPALGDVLLQELGTRHAVGSHLGRPERRHGLIQLGACDAEYVRVCVP